jgi:hypothetical protein
VRTPPPDNEARFGEVAKVLREIVASATNPAHVNQAARQLRRVERMNIEAAERDELEKARRDESFNRVE